MMEYMKGLLTVRSSTQSGPHTSEMDQSTSDPSIRHMWIRSSLLRRNYKLEYSIPNYKHRCQVTSRHGRHMVALPVQLGKAPVFTAGPTYNPKALTRRLATWNQQIMNKAKQHMRFHVHGFLQTNDTIIAATTST